MFLVLQGPIRDLETRPAANIAKVEALQAEGQPEVDKIPSVVKTITHFQEKITAERDRLGKAEPLVSEMMRGRKEYEDKVIQILVDSKEAQDMVQSCNQVHSRWKSSPIQELIKK